MSHRPEPAGRSNLWLRQVAVAWLAAISQPMVQLSLDDPANVLSLMVESLLPYEQKRAQAAAVQLVGGPVKALFAANDIVDLHIQLEAMTLATKNGHPEEMIDVFRENARMALTSLNEG